MVLLEDTPPAAAVEHTGPHTNTAANTGETPVADTIAEPWAEWDEWAALAEEEARSHNYRDPALSSRGENDLVPSTTHRRRRMHAAFDEDN